MYHMGRADILSPVLRTAVAESAPYGCCLIAVCV
jgi:hypothetical protein